ncbi:MAG: ComEC/Rec2 family competence protein [Deferribacterales bacterium]
MFKKIILLWQQFKFKTEMFFVLSVLSAVLSYPSEKAMLVAGFLLPAVFIGKRTGIVIGLLTAVSAYLLAGHLLITEIKKPEGDNWLYKTTWGSLLAPAGLQPGDVLSGKFRKKTYAFLKDGRFSAGYYISERIDRKTSVPFIKSILLKREKLSDGLYYSTGGKLVLTQALTLGDRRYIPQAMNDLFLVTGLGHLLSVSGMHVAVLAGMLFFLFSFLPSKLRLIPMMLSMLLLMPLTGFTVTVCRAALFGFFVMGAKLLDYRTDTGKLLLFAAGMFILLTPSLLGDISFILSFSAVLGLVYLPNIRNNLLASVAVGLAASAFIMPAAAAVFGMFNISSVISTIILSPVVALQMAVFGLYCFFPEHSVAPLLFLEDTHMLIVRFFSDHSDFFYQVYKPDKYVIGFMILFLLYTLVRRRVLAAAVLLMLPYLPADKAPRAVETTVSKAEKPTETQQNIRKGAYFMGYQRSKAFVILDGKVHIFYKGTYGDFKYKFVPFLTEMGISKADTGTITIYNGENYLIKIDNDGEDYGGVCVNETRADCKAVYHTRSNTYDCYDDKRLHILYNNDRDCRNMILLKKSGDVVLNEDTYKR